MEIIVLLVALSVLLTFMHFTKMSLNGPVQVACEDYKFRRLTFKELKLLESEVKEVLGYFWKWKIDSESEVLHMIVGGFINDLDEQKETSLVS